MANGEAPFESYVWSEQAGYDVSQLLEPKTEPILARLRGARLVGVRFAFGGLGPDYRREPEADDLWRRMLSGLEAVVFIGDTAVGRAFPVYHFASRSVRAPMFKLGIRVPANSRVAVELRLSPAARTVRWLEDAKAFIGRNFYGEIFPLVRYQPPEPDTSAEQRFDECLEAIGKPQRERDLEDSDDLFAETLAELARFDAAADADRSAFGPNVQELLDQLEHDDA